MEPASLNERDTELIDARKPFEYEVGTFEEQSILDDDNFREFPKLPF